MISNLNYKMENKQRRRVDNVLQTAEPYVGPPNDIDIEMATIKH